MLGIASSAARLSRPLSRRQWLVLGGKVIVANSPRNFPPYGAVLAKLRPSGGKPPDFVHRARWGQGQTA
jgi:hypothetical protein